MSAKTRIATMTQANENTPTLTDVLTGIDELRQATQEQGERLSTGMEVLTDKMEVLTDKMEMLTGKAEVLTDQLGRLTEGLTEMKGMVQEQTETSKRQEQNISRLVNVVETLIQRQQP
jgi:archaellum component FlaC